MTIYPEFYKDPYSDYLKEKINKWLSECFVAYNIFFRIKAYQHEAVFYEYDSEKDKKDINLKKLWTNPFGSYKIYISGTGMLHKGISNSIDPPLNIVDNLIDKITFKYQESSDISHPMIMAYGKKIGIPIKYTCENPDAEGWNNGFCDEDVFSPNWEININSSQTKFDEIYSILEELTAINVNKEFDVDIDVYNRTIGVKTAFLLSNKDKVEYFKLLNKLADLVVQDDSTEVNICNMNFTSQKDSVFTLEKHYFDEILGKFIIKNAHID
jgi:hypothetical protein